MFRTLSARLFAVLMVGLGTIQIVSFFGFMVFRGEEIKEQMMWGDEQFYDKEKWDRLRFSDGFMAELAQLVAQIPEEQRQQFNQAIAGAITPFLQAQQPAQQTAPNPSAPAAVAAA